MLNECQYLYAICVLIWFAEWKLLIYIFKVINLRVGILVQTKLWEYMFYICLQARQGNDVVLDICSVLLIWSLLLGSTLWDRPPPKNKYDELICPTN